MRLTLPEALPWPRWVTGLIAAVLLAGGWVLALRHLPPVHHIRWSLVVLAVLTVPVTLAANAAEFGLTAALGGQTVRRPEAVRVTLAGSAANALPIPGSALVRIRALQRGGLRVRGAVGLTALVGVCWLATAATAGGFLLLVAGRADIGSAALVPGVVLLGVALWLLARGHTDATASLLIGLCGVELLTVAADGTRLWLLSRALHLNIPFSTAVMLTVAAAISSAIGVVPAGLGVREGIAAGLGALLGVPAALAFTVTGASRLAEYAVLAPAVGIVLSRPAPTSASVDPAPTP